ncbi:MAG TPA: exodeoxyribonuclease V subunit gamma [Casimicrobiaceae bacterium]|nr:exodeoxyribonuclease V subunit gamma [Casimicrobiaceae bacterium]
MLHIRFSNRFEHLQDALLDAMATPPASPFVGEEIIVPSAAMRRRVELAAADRFGICSNVRFSFLAQWLWRQIGHGACRPRLAPRRAGHPADRGPAAGRPPADNCRPAQPQRSRRWPA